MPAYELFLIVKNLKRPELVQSVKRGAELIISRNGLIRSFENLGYKNLPFRMKSKDGYHTSGNYLLIKFDSPSREVPSIMSEISKDADYLRSGVSPLVEYGANNEEDNFQVECKCKEEGQFNKFGFDFEKPMTVWKKKKIFKNYGLRL